VRDQVPLELIECLLRLEQFRMVFAVARADSVEEILQTIKLLPGEEVVGVNIAVHSEPVERKPAKEFTVLLTPRNSAYTVREAHEIQFAGFAKAHIIPNY